MISQHIKDMNEKGNIISDVKLRIKQCSWRKGIKNWKQIN